MTLRKFGTGDGEVTEVEEQSDPKIVREAVRREWTDQDAHALEEESKEGPRGGELPPTP
jgi:hypothetical protein